jgi:hypothetical protein
MSGGYHSIDMYSNSISMAVLQLMNQEQRFREELKKELKGEKETFTAVIQTGESTNNVQANTDDGAEMGKLLLSRKKRKLLEAMQVHFFMKFLVILVILRVYFVL